MKKKDCKHEFLELSINPDRAGQYYCDGCDSYFTFSTHVTPVETTEIPANPTITGLLEFAAKQTPAIARTLRGYAKSWAAQMHEQMACREAMRAQEAAETTGDVFARFPAGTIFQKHANGNISVLTPAGGNTVIPTDQLSATDRLHNLCDALSEQADESPFTREEWERVDRQTARLNTALKNLIDATEDTLRSHPETECCSVTRQRCQEARDVLAHRHQETAAAQAIQQVCRKCGSSDVMPWPTTPVKAKCKCGQYLVPYKGCPVCDVPAVNG